MNNSACATAEQLSENVLLQQIGAALENSGKGFQLQ
jgi:hypothetical protein